MTDDSRVSDAFATVPEEYYTHDSDGSLITQSSSAEAIAEMLVRLDVQPGMNVLEVGAGSGFSGALLSELVGERGTVVSVDVVSDLVGRAKALHAERGRKNIRVIAGDGAKGVPGHAPYDRIVAWASSDRLHRTWADQCAPGAVLVIPVTLTDLPRSNGIVRARTTGAGQLTADRLWPGGYVEMHSEVLTQWLVPPRGVQARTVDEAGTPWWISAAWAGRNRRDAESLLALLSAEAVENASPFEASESVEDFHGFLYAMRPSGLSMLGLGADGWAPGHTTPKSATVLRRDGRLVSAGGSESPEIMHRWLTQWRSTGRPGITSLRPVLEESDNGWLVRAQV